MKDNNILVLTSEYPNPNSSYDTPVVHYYAKEWVKLGHKVKVVHYRSVFPFIFYFFVRIFNKILKSIFKTDFIPEKRLKETLRYEMDGVTIISRPIFKIFPHFKFFNSTLKKEINFIIKENESDSFDPNYIIGHFFNPQLPLLGLLKPIYPKATTSLVLHENPTVINSLFGNKSKELINNIDYFGFRYERMKESFVEQYGRDKNLFLCPSGIPAEYILDELPVQKFKNSTITYAFIGMLIPLKNVDVLIDSLNIAHPDGNFQLRIYGEGMLREKLENQIKHLNLGKSITLEGRLSRNDIQKVLEEIDVFVMVSNPEAFGLVYLEAMSKGCITIGTIGQGIDGTIKNGVNGFLCKSNDVQGLSDLLKSISKMTYQEKYEIGCSAIETAKKMSDQQIAKEYLKKIGFYSS